MFEIFKAAAGELSRLHDHATTAASSDMSLQAGVLSALILALEMLAQHEGPNQEAAIEAGNLANAIFCAFGVDDFVRRAMAANALAVARGDYTIAEGVVAVPARLANTQFYQKIMGKDFH